MSMRVLEYRAERQDEGIRLELVLKRKLGLSMRQIRQLKYLPGGITINGVQRRTDRLVHYGDMIRVSFSDQKRKAGEVLPLEKPLHILYEDADLLIIDKRAGEICHPAHGHHQDTLANQVAAYLRGKENDPSLIRCIGRLDKDTSGTLLFAKNQLAAGRLAQQREEGTFYKEYLALVNGTFPSPERSGEIRLPIAPAPGKLMTMQISPTGKKAVTRYEVLCSDSRCSLVLCRIQTGRTHQIRVHMTAIGHPLLGDPLYGNGVSVSSSRTALHAWKLHLRQPVSGEQLVIESFRENMFS